MSSKRGLRLLVYAVLAVVLPALGSRAAFAQAGQPRELTPTERQRARMLFRSAEASMVASRWGEALGIYDELLALKETAALRYNRGVCHAKLGHWVAAYDDYKRTLELSMGSEGADLEYLADASRRGLRDAARYVAEVEVTVGPVLRGVHPTLLIDGVQYGLDHEAGYQNGRLTWGPFRLPRGEHAVEVRLEGRAPLRHVLRLAEASASDRELAAVVELAWPESVSRPPSAELAGGRTSAVSQSTLTLPLLVGGIGVGAAACSAGLFVAHLARDADAEGGPSYLSAALVTGGAALGAGAFTLAYAVVAAPTRTLISAAVPPKREPTPRGVVAPTRDGVGVVWSGSFW